MIFIFIKHWKKMDNEDCNFYTKPRAYKSLNSSESQSCYPVGLDLDLELEQRYVEKDENFHVKSLDIYELAVLKKESNLHQ